MKFTELVSLSEMRAGPMRQNKDGFTTVYEINGKKITVTMDEEFPMTFIFGKIETLLEDIEKEIKEKM